MYSEPPGLNLFLGNYSGMSLRSCRGSETILVGKFTFSASLNEHTITDTYKLRIVIPKTFPRGLPIVFDADNKIPRPANGSFHVNQDGSLCLGSQIRLLNELSEAPDLLGFAQKCLIPYLYAISLKIEKGGNLVFGELAHGAPGAIKDYADLWRLTGKDQVLVCLQRLAEKKRIANKRPCPCGCCQRLGACGFNRLVRKFRKMAARKLYRVEKQNLST